MDFTGIFITYEILESPDLIIYHEDSINDHLKNIKDILDSDK
jgi:adenylylsulfate kinase-like enzyme